MEIKLQGVRIIISTNPNNFDWWKHSGSYQNCPYVERDGIWYKCGISFFERDAQFWMRISDLRQVKENSSIITHMERGVYKELPISKFQKLRCEIALNRHSLNRRAKVFTIAFRRRKGSIGVFAQAIGLALIYYFGNESYHGAWADYIAKNSYLQALFILLNIFSIGSVFYPFTIQKPLSESDIRQICQEEAAKYDKKKETNRQLEERATF